MNEDNLVLKKSDNFICWRPNKGDNSLLLSLQDYKIFHKFSRTVHFDQFQEINKSGEMTPKKFHVVSHSHLGSLHPSCEVLWFGVHNPHQENNCYGNTSLIADARDFLSHYVRNLNIYFVEVIDFKTCNASRILISDREYHDLPLYDPYQYGGPWHIDPAGHHYHLQNARRYDKVSNKYGHRLEFMLDLPREERERLYRELKPLPVAHHEANTGKPHKCIEHGTSGKCPSPWNKEEARDMLKKELEPKQKEKSRRNLQF